VSTRPLLSLFRLDQGALAAFEAELRDLLTRDDRDGLIALLGLGGSFVDLARAAPRAVDLFLVPESEATHAGLYKSLRRVAKKRSLEHAWTSESAALEGRLREYDVIREDANLASRVDALLDSSRVPWFLRRPGATAGALGSPDRQALADALHLRRDELPEEVGHLADALGELEGDVLCHDGLP
jgi:hypothetical protein